MRRLFTAFGRDFVWGQNEERGQQLALPFQDYVNMFSYGGVQYPFQVLRQTLVGNREEVGSDYRGLAAGALFGNSVAFTCMCVRLLAFSEVRFQFRQNGKLFGTPELAPLETPWPGATTGDLLGRMIQDVDLAGNAYITRSGDRLIRLRPDWVTIVLGSRSRRAGWVPGAIDTEVAAYQYQPGGKGSGNDPVVLLPETVAHFAPYPDPTASYRGMTWLSPLVREIGADSMMTSHKSKFLENGATVNLVVKVPATTVDTFNQWVEKIREGHDGVHNAYRTLFLAQGADATAIGSDLQQMDFANVQGKGETRIAAAAGVPPVIAGFSEGLQGSSLNEGNYRAAARRFTDVTIRPLWRNAAGSLRRIINIPPGAELWYDPRDVAFLKEDVKDAATVRQADATAIRTLVDGGFDADAVVQAVTSGDLSTLSGKHTGLVSVQLLPPGQNGNGNGNMPAMSGGTQ